MLPEEPPSPRRNSKAEQREDTHCHCASCGVVLPGEDKAGELKEDAGVENVWDTLDQDWSAVDEH